MIYEVDTSEKADLLFEGSTDTSILSCLQNVMGHLFVDDREDPAAAMAVLGDFCFVAGRPNREMISDLPECCMERECVILVPQSDDWEPVIEECYGENARKVTRYAIRKEGDIFDRKALEQVVAGLSEEFCIRIIDESLFYRCSQIPWCCDWVAQYDSYELFQKHGLGVVILRGDEIVAGASSYSGYLSGIEIEIDTREDYRRRGLAYVSGAKLILECLKRGWYPSWDAQNKWSAALAQKLGYHYSHEYTAYELTMSADQAKS